MNKTKSSILTNFVIPFLIFFKSIKRFIERIKLDGFAGGLIFGAVFTLIVNIITAQITDEIARQRALEALENEIALNTIKANTIIIQNNKNISNNILPNIFYTYQQYEDNVWSNSTTLQYLEQINPNVQANVNNYYEYQIKGNNTLLANLNSLSRSVMQNCFGISNPLTPDQVKTCKAQNAIFEDIERSSAIAVSKSGYVLLSQFHPTKDRLHNPILLMLMSNNAIGFLR